MRRFLKTVLSASTLLAPTLLAAFWCAGVAADSATDKTIDRETSSEVNSEANSGVNSATERLQGYLGDLNSLSGRFAQRQYDDTGELILEASGQFNLQRPGKFRWHTQEPFEQLLISDQQTIWLYDPDLEQVTIKPYTEDLAQTPAVILSGSADKIAQQFQVSETQNTQNEAIFVLTPNTESALFVDLRLSFSEQKLTTIVLNDSLGQRTEFALTEALLNPEQSAGLFTFEVPKGIDVLRDE